jgi:nucleoid-associated protein YgaU
MLSEPEKLGIELPDPDGFQPLARISTPRQLQRLDLLSEVSGLEQDVLRALNPLLRNASTARGERQLLLPEDAAAELLAFMERVRLGEIPLPEPRLHTVVSGDTLSAIARRHGLSVAEIQQWNGLAPRAVLRIGQILRLEPPLRAP